MDDAINAGTAVRASCQELRDAGAATTMPSQVWPAGDCPLCQSGTPLDQPAS